MQTTGSRTLFGMRLTAVRLLLAVASMLLLSMVGVFTALGTQQAQAGQADSMLTVNSTANTETAPILPVTAANACGGFPNTTNLAGDCTLREAINAVNAGLADKINFHPTTFSVATPGVIDIEGGLGCLPAIDRPVTIDSANTGVVIDGDNSLDGLSPIGCDAGLKVRANGNGFDFTLIGGKHFTIRDIGAGPDGDAIELNGSDGGICTVAGGICSFRNIIISGLITRAIAGNGIDTDNTTNLSNVMITNVDIQANDDGLDLDADAILPIVLTNNIVNITESRILGDKDDNGSGDGVHVDFDGDLGGTLTVNVNDNIEITSLGDDAVDVDYCQGGGCEADGRTINFSANGNDKIHADNDGISFDVFPDASEAADGGRVIVNLTANGNGLLDSGSDGVDFDVGVCCATSDSVSTLTVDGNQDIIADERGVEIGVDLGCGDTNKATTNVTNNHSIESSDNDGVQISHNVGEAASGCDFGGPPGDPTDDSDSNESTVNVNHNANIDGGGSGDEGIEIDVEAGAGSAPGDGDDNTSVVNVKENTEIHGDDDGVDVNADAGSDSGDSSDDNKSTVNLGSNTGRITGDDDDGADLNADAGTQGGNNATDDGDDDKAEINVTNNTGTISGNDGDGVKTDVFAGGATSGSQNNSTTVNITGNAAIHGETDSGGDGIDADANVCCDSRNTNTLTIANNTGNITSGDDDAIDIFMDATDFADGDAVPGGGAIHKTTIEDNTGLIRGNDDNGIEYFATTTCPDPVPAAPTCPIRNSLNILKIGDGPDADTLGNNISNSDDNGIDICCGAFDGAAAGTKSEISNNTISHNTDHGIELHNTVGINIGPKNVISANGNDPAVDRGIEIDCDGFTSPFVFPCHYNKITQNSIFDNIGLGIDLNGDTTPPTATSTHGIGCTPFATGISPNDCIPFPVITLIASGDKVGGTTCSLCHIELFLADATPADQTGPFGREHGEGKTFQINLGSDEATAAGIFSIILPCGLSAGDITATATDKQKNTSEFSANAPFLGSRSCATATPTVTNTFTPAPTATQGPPTLTPTATVPAKDCGDVNDDGLVNSVDSLLILQLTAALITTLDNIASADVNNSGDITSVDAALILQKEAALILQSALVCA